MSAKRCGGQISHLLGSLIAATFVSPRLNNGFAFFRSHFSYSLKNRNPRSSSLKDSEGCLSAKGCGVGLLPFGGSFIAAAFVSQSDTVLKKKNGLKL